MRQISVRTRFELFKRDHFTCQYCGRKSPEVVLELDHIVPVSDGGGDDPVNLITACWECNRGKSAVPLAQVMTGEDPHDKAIELLERERQVREYNELLAQIRNRRESEAWELVRHWKYEQGYRSDEELATISNADYQWLFGALEHCPKEIIRKFMDYAIQRDMTRNLRYVAACCRNWRYEQQAQEDVRAENSDDQA